jgi:hypothetical protein
MRIHISGIITTMKTVLRAKAVSLRKHGRSIKYIARKLGVSPSTASRWCTPIILSDLQKNALENQRRLAGIRSLAPWIQRNRELKRHDLVQQSVNGRKDIGKISARDIFMLGIGLYWGEGYKRGSQELGFTNSDPVMLRCMLVWLREWYGVQRRDIIARLTINERYAKESSRLHEDWSAALSIPITQFTKPSFIRGYSAPRPQGNTYRGTVRIKVRRGTSLRRRILAAIGETANQIK